MTIRNATATTGTRDWLPTASLVLAMLLWASSFVALKIAFAAYHPMVVIFGRMAVASLCFAAFIPGFCRLKFSRRDIKLLLLMSAFEPCCYFLFEAKALENTTASQAGMITAMLPLLVAITAWLVLGERITRKTLTGFGLAIIGACLLSLTSETSATAPNPLLGNSYEFLAMVCAAGYTVTLKHLSSRFPPLFLTASMAFVGSLFFFPFLLLPCTELPQTIAVGPAMAIVYLGTAVTLLAYGLYNYAVGQLPASQAAGYVNLIPVFSVLLGMLILKETLTLPQWAACGLVLAGVAISSRGGRKKRRTA